MITIILTGASRGLGKEIHDLLIGEILSNTECHFITRSPVENQSANFKYSLIDFNNFEVERLSIDIDPSSDLVFFINNAGVIDPIKKAQDISKFDIDFALRVNFTGPLMLAQYLTSQTKLKGAKLFVLNITSGAARHPVHGWMAYCVSKAAAVMAFDVLALENMHVRAEHFDPGVMDTDMQSCIRKQKTEVMPDVNKFTILKEDQSLKSPKEVAVEIVSKIKELSI